MSALSAQNKSSPGSTKKMSVTGTNEQPGQVHPSIADRQFHLPRLTRVAEQVSKDGSRKYLLGLQDGKTIETVLMPHHDHHTVCVSSQVGCAMGCSFCVTGKMGLIRNLSAGEIVEQVVKFSKCYWITTPQHCLYGNGRTFPQL